MMYTYNILQNEKNTISVAGLDMRTTSVLEAMHSVIQRTFPQKTHIFKFIENLKLHEATKSTDLYRLSKGDQIQQKRAEDKERAQKIEKCTEDLERGTITVARFLDLMSKKKLDLSKKKSTLTVSECCRICAYRTCPSVRP